MRWVLTFQRCPPAGGVGEDVGQPLAVGEIAAQILQQRDQRVERGADLVGVGARRCPSRCRAGSTASRVVSARPRPASASPSCPTASPTTCISALAVSCGRWLRNASSRSCACASRTRGSAPSAPMNAVSLSSDRRIGTVEDRPCRSGRSAVVGHGLQTVPAASAATGGREQIRPRVLEAALRRAGQRMAADEREARRQRRAPRRRSRASCCRCR